MSLAATAPAAVAAAVPATPAVPVTSAAPAAGSTLASLGSMVFSLALVLALILAVAWVLRRVQGSASAANAPLRVVASLNVGPRERIVIIEAAGQQWLLGVTAQQVTPLAPLAHPVRGDAARQTLFATLLARQGSGAA